MRALWAFFVRDVLNETSYKLSFFLQLLSILTLVLMFYYLSRLVDNAVSGPLGPYGGNYFPFVLIGIAVQNYLTMSLGGFSGSLRDAQLSGTLEAVLTAPISPFTFLFGSILYGFFFNSLRILVYLAIGTLLFQAQFHWERLPLVLLVMVLTMAAFSILGILSASFMIVFKRGDPFNWVFSVASWLLGGVYYPVSVLPEWLQEIALLIPMTHSLEALRQTLLCGEDLFSPWGHVIALGIWTAIGLPLSILCCTYALKYARLKGTLGHY